MATDSDIIIVGGGLAGLCCARTLHGAGRSFLLLEATDAVGGRVRTDTVDGFRLDRGFQVLLTAYPEARSVLDYAALDLKPFYPGALVRVGGRFHRVAEWQHLRTYRIAEALPDYGEPGALPGSAYVDQGNGIYLCGDAWATPSIQGAMVSGRRVAEAILAANP